MKSALKEHFKLTFANYRWLLHLIFWTIVIGISIQSLISINFFHNPKFPQPFSTQSYLVSVACMLLLCYTFLLFIVPLYGKFKGYVFWVAFTINIIFWYGLDVLIVKMIGMGIPIINSRPDFTYMNLLDRFMTSFLFLFSFFIAFYYFVDIYDRQKGIKRLAQFKTQKIALESSFLKSQINPHFLFNTLNNIYALSLKQSPQTPVIIDRLESLLHYMLYECKADLVPLENEFVFTNSYIALEKLRHKEDQCKVTIQINGDTEHHQIAPLLLINFLENAFKHGTKTSFGKSWINMEINISKKSLHFNLQNSKPQKPANQVISEYTGGIGLKNVKRRLEILYPKRHQLVINNAADYFEVDLSINF